MAPAFSTASAATATYRPVTFAPSEPWIVGCRPGASKPQKRRPPAGVGRGAPALPPRQPAPRRSRRAALRPRGGGDAPRRLVPRSHAAGAAVAREAPLYYWLAGAAFSLL